MPVSRSGVTFEVYSVPNGVGMARPPANSLPPGAVWQATQSPAWARYSPRATVDLSLPAGRVCAETPSVDPMIKANDPTAPERMSFRKGGLDIASPLVRFAAARQRHRQRTPRHR